MNNKKMPSALPSQQFKSRTNVDSIAMCTNALLWYI